MIVTGSAMFGSTVLRVAALVSALLLTGPRSVAGSGGLMDDERLLYSNGDWHRLQRKRVPFEAACYFTHEKELPHGCQYSKSIEPAWHENPVRKSERKILSNFFEALGGDWKTTGKSTGGWRTIDNWNIGDPCWDHWYGITCDEHGHIIAIELVDNNLHGTLTDDIGQLKNLLKLDVSTTAPSYHNHANRIANRITGKLPSLKDISRIEEITISGNEFTALPVDLFENGASLRMISASYNRLTAMPKYLNRFTKLHTLELDHNQIEGELPPDLGLMTSARYIHVDNNRLSGKMPASITGLTRIRTFDVSQNPGLYDAIPEDVIVNWAEVEYLSILGTGITGYIAALCLDLPFCWKYQFDTHKDLTWAGASDIPDSVNLTRALAAQNPDGPRLYTGPY